jgi:hypothetical protein
MDRLYTAVTPTAINGLSVSRSLAFRAELFRAAKSPDQRARLRKDLGSKSQAPARRTQPGKCLGRWIPMELGSLHADSCSKPLDCSK